ncbi:hypothetical protein LguiB_023197 [Lonicera macranthoides]
MVNLMVLDLSYTAELNAIPVRMLAALVKLKVMNAYCSSYEEWIVEESEMVVGSQAFVEELEWLKLLNHLGISIKDVPALETLGEDSRRKIQSSTHSLLVMRKWWNELEWDDENVNNALLHHFKEIQYEALFSSFHQTVAMAKAYLYVVMVWSWLSSNESKEPNSRITKVFSMGGVGKTALVKRINNEFLKTPLDFNQVIFVDAAKSSSLKSMQLAIARKLGQQWPNTVEAGERSTNISDALKKKKKKLVLFIDDPDKELTLNKYRNLDSAQQNQ